MQRKPTAREDWCGYQRKWYEANKEKILAKKRHRYRVERAHATDRYAQILETNRRWHEEHPDYQREYYAANRDRIREYMRNWYLERRTKRGRTSSELS